MKVLKWIMLIAAFGIGCASKGVREADINQELRKTNYDIGKEYYSHGEQLENKGEHGKALEVYRKAIKAFQKGITDGDTLEIGPGNETYSIGPAVREGMKESWGKIKYLSNGETFEEYHSKRMEGLYEVLMLQSTGMKGWASDVVIDSDCINPVTFLKKASYEIGKERYEEAIKYCELALKSAEKNKQGWLSRYDYSDQELYGFIYDRFGAAYAKQSELEKTTDFYQKGIEAYLNTGFKFGAADLHFELGGIYKEKTDYAKSIEHFEEAAKLWEEFRRHDLLEETYSSIGMIYEELGDSSKSLDYYFKAIEHGQQIKPHRLEFR